MIDHDNKLPVASQAKLLGISRANVYYLPKTESEADPALMRRIDELHLERPFAGARMLRDMLRREGHQIGRKRVRTLMGKLGIAALYRKPNTSRRHVAHLVYPYLLRNLSIDRPNQVWATDVTYVPMKRGFVYLCAVLDWATRRVLSWRLSNTMTADFIAADRQPAAVCRNAVVLERSIRYEVANGRTGRGRRRASTARRTRQRPFHCVLFARGTLGSGA